MALTKPSWRQGTAFQSTFISLKVSLMRNCQPPHKVWRTAQMMTSFIFLLFSPCFLGVLCVIGVTVWRYGRSLAFRSTKLWSVTWYQAEEFAFLYKRNYINCWWKVSGLHVFWKQTCSVSFWECGSLSNLSHEKMGGEIKLHWSFGFLFKCIKMYFS